MSRKVAELKGVKALHALNGFSALLLGLKMLPSYRDLPYEKFYASFNDKTDAHKETLLREAVAFVQLQHEEIVALIGFCHDVNGVPYQEANAKSLPLKELHEIIVAVCMEIGRIRVTLVTEDEKKNLTDSQ